MYRSRYHRSRPNVRRWQLAAVVGAGVMIAGVGIGVASAADAVPTVNCPQLNLTVAVPAQANNEVQRNLALLNTQIAEANNRLRNSVGQGGPNFIQNAILGPLADKRNSTINRIETAIGRNAAKPDLNSEGLAACTLNQDGGASAQQSTEVPGAAEGDGGAAGGDDAGGGNAGVPTVACPQVALTVAVPAAASDEVGRNLALLNTQIAEANNRLRNSVGQGGANFIQNAILGPLADKRFSTINRIETAIGRRAAKPDLNAEGLSKCSLNQDGAASAQQDTGVSGAAQGGESDEAAGSAAAGTISCPAVNVNVAVPAQAKAEVDRNLALLNTQIAEANNRLRNSVGQGGANFVRNAILGPLADKRNSTIKRIETAIGRNGAKPNLNAAGLADCTVS
jgi:F0F1-type ATP synthase membrane subunit b/b'